VCAIEARINSQEEKRMYIAHYHLREVAAAAGTIEVAEEYQK
jgi:hypothetical protein